MKTEWSDMRIIGALNGTQLLQDSDDGKDADKGRAKKYNDIFKDEFTIAKICEKICEGITCEQICDGIICEGKICEAIVCEAICEAIYCEDVTCSAICDSICDNICTGVCDEIA